LIDFYILKINTSNPEDYKNQLPEGRKEAISKLRKTIVENLPEGFAETMTYGMISYAVPHSVYPKGYHADPKQPLIGELASRISVKNWIKKI
jgi:hypothetical protein